MCKGYFALIFAYEKALGEMDALFLTEDQKEKLVDDSEQFGDILS